MKLSEAILKGCKGTTKSDHYFFESKTCCCTFGAAALALNPNLAGSLDTDYICNLLERKFPELQGSGPGRLWTEIIAMNEDKSREEIAVWLQEKGL